MKEDGGEQVSKELLSHRQKKRISPMPAYIVHVVMRRSYRTMRSDRKRAAAPSLIDTLAIRRSSCAAPLNTIATSSADEVTCKTRIPTNAPRSWCPSVLTPLRQSQRELRVSSLCSLACCASPVYLGSSRHCRAAWKLQSSGED